LYRFDSPASAVLPPSSATAAGTRSTTPSKSNATLSPSKSPPPPRAEGAVNKGGYNPAPAVTVVATAAPPLGDVLFTKNQKLQQQQQQWQLQQQQLRQQKNQQRLSRQQQRQQLRTDDRSVNSQQGQSKDRANPSDAATGSPRVVPVLDASSRTRTLGPADIPASEDDISQLNIVKSRIAAFEKQVYDFVV